MARIAIGEMTYGIIGRIFPRPFVREVGEHLERAGLDILPEMFLGFMITSCIILGAVAFFISAQVIQFEYAVAVFFLVVVIIAMIAYAVISLQIDGRRKQVDTILPDFLQLAAANVRAGMPVDQAIWFAARPEFGIFSKEMEIIAKKTIGGASFAQTLMKLNSRFHSRILKRTISLIIQGMASGGEMAEILERTAWDVRRMQLLQKEISASLLMYTIFIIFSAVIGAPALYALSFKMIEMIVQIWSGITAGGLDIAKMSQTSGMLLITPTPPGVKPIEFYYFGVCSTALTAIMASFITACISTGSARNGFKYIPFFLVGALGVFFGVTFLFDKMFGSLA